MPNTINYHNKLFSNGCSFLGSRPVANINTFTTKILAQEYDLQLLLAFALGVPFLLLEYCVEYTKQNLMGLLILEHHLYEYYFLLINGKLFHNLNGI